MSERLPEKIKDIQNNWKTSRFALGGVLGLLAGLASAYLYTRSAEENNSGRPPARISTGDIFRLVLSAVGLVRLISDMGADRQDRSNKR